MTDWHSHRISRRGLLAASALGAAGCTSLPTHGPVEPLAQARPVKETSGVAIAPQSPIHDGDPEVILAGFMDAMRSADSDYAGARLFLTPAAQKEWVPTQSTTVYEAENNRPVVTSSSASLKVPLVGRLDSWGRFTPAQGTLTHDFGMQRVAGQWRISRPPQGVLVARYAFHRYYSPLQVYFLSGDGTHLVGETVHRLAETLTPTEAVRVLLARPSSWLAPAVGTALPADTRMSVSAVVVSDEVAEVSFTEQIATLAAPQRNQLAAQLVATLRQFDHVTGVRILHNGQPWQVPASNAAGVVGPEILDQLRLLDSREEAPVHAIRDGRLGLVDPTFRAVDGPVGLGKWGDAPGSLAVQRSGQAMALVNRDGDKLYRLADATAAPQLVRVGKGLLRPQVLEQDAIWTIEQGQEAPVLVVAHSSGRMLQTPLADLRGRTVIAFRVAPDRARLALVTRRGKSLELGLMRIRGLDPLMIDGWRGLPLTSSSGPLVGINDVAWADRQNLLLVASAGSGGYRNVFRARADGSFVENLGPSGSGGSPVRVSAFVRREGTTAVLLNEAGEVYEFQGSYRWERMLTGVSDVAFPG